MHELRDVGHSLNLLILVPYSIRSITQILVYVVREYVSFGKDRGYQPHLKLCHLVSW
jgi:hypothetical protein